MERSDRSRNTSGPFHGDKSAAQGQRIRLPEKTLPQRKGDDSIEGMSRKSPVGQECVNGVRIQALISFLALVLMAMLLVFSSSASKLRRPFNGKGYAARSRTSAGPHIYLDEKRELPVAYVGDKKAVETLTAGEASPLSMTSGDIDGDGIDDLLIGYATSQGGVIAVHRGNLDAFAPQSTESFEAIGRGDFPSPFLKQASVFSVPVRPDFIATGNFGDSEYKSLVVAARGGTTLYLLSSDGEANFTNATAVNLPGAVTALSAGQLGTGQQYANLIVGVAGETPALMIFKGSAAGLSSLSCHPLKAAPSNIDGPRKSSMAIIHTQRVAVSRAWSVA